jgi:small acid-soluble spore protein I (minor)
MAAIQSLTLRQAIIERVKNLTEDELREVVQDSTGSDERSLPGLGVLFEIMWEHLDDHTKEKLIATLKVNLPQESQIHNQPTE